MTFLKILIVPINVPLAPSGWGRKLTPDHSCLAPHGVPVTSGRSSSNGWANEIQQYNIMSFGHEEIPVAILSSCCGNSLLDDDCSVVS